MKRASAFAVGMLLFLVPLVILGWLRFRYEDRLDQVHVNPTPVQIEATERMESSPLSVELVATWGQPSSIAAPAWGGMVTDSELTPGSVINEGSVVLQVDGIDRIASMTEHPFHRSLSQGDRGPDVAEAQALLARLGLYEGETDGVFGPGMTIAARSLAGQLGVDRPDGRIELAWFVWVPFQGFEVGTVDALVGFPAPDVGAAWISGIPPLVEVRVVGQDGGEIDLSGQWRLTVEGTIVTLFDGEVSGDDLERLPGLSPDALGSQSDSNAEPVETRITGEVELAQPVPVLEVPATAIVTTTSGDLCLYRVKEGSYEPMQVEIASGRAGLVAVTQGLLPGELILANPVDILVDLTCR